jgi:hypothetical protein
LTQEDTHYFSGPLPCTVTNFFATCTFRNSVQSRKPHRMFTFLQATIQFRKIHSCSYFMYISQTPKIMVSQTEKSSREHKRLVIWLIIWNHEFSLRNCLIEKRRALRVSLSTTHEPRPEGLCTSINVQLLESRDVPHAIWNSCITWQSYVMASTSVTRSRKHCGQKQHVSVILSVCLSIRALSTYTIGSNQLFSYFKHGKADNVRSPTATTTNLLFNSSHHHRKNHPSLSSTPYYIIIKTVVTTPVITSLTHQYHHYSHSRFTMIITIIKIICTIIPHNHQQYHHHSPPRYINIIIIILFFIITNKLTIYPDPAHIQLSQLLALRCSPVKPAFHRGSLIVGNDRRYESTSV